MILVNYNPDLSSEQGSERDLFNMCSPFISHHRHEKIMVQGWRDALDRARAAHERASQCPGNLPRPEEDARGSAHRGDQGSSAGHGWCPQQNQLR